METQSLEDEVRLTWDDLISQGVNQNKARTTILRSYPPDRRSIVDKILVDIIRSQFVRKGRNTYEESSPYFMCQSDDDGYAIDPFTRSRIPEDKLISYTDTRSKKWCFDIDSLYVSWKTSDTLVNPLTREPIPDYVIDKLRPLHRPLIVSIRDGSSFEIDTRVESIADVIMTSIKLQPGGSVFDNLVIYDVSVYDQDMNSRDVPPSIEVSEFASNTRRDYCLLKLMRYMKTKSDQLSASVALFIGAFLKLIPIFENQNIPIDEDTTIIQALKIAWTYSGGLNMWNTVEVVLDNGTPISDYGFNDRLVDVIPGEVLRMIQFTNDEAIDELHSSLDSYSFIMSDEELVIALHGKSEVDVDNLDEGGYTLLQLRDVIASDPSIIDDKDKMGKISKMLHEHEITSSQFAILVRPLVGMTDPNIIKNFFRIYNYYGGSSYIRLILKEYEVTDKDINKLTYLKLLNQAIALDEDLLGAMMLEDKPYELSLSDIGKLDSPVMMFKYFREENYLRILSTSLGLLGWKVLRDLTNSVVDKSVSITAHSVIKTLISSNRSNGQYGTSDDQVVMSLSQLQPLLSPSDAEELLALSLTVDITDVLGDDFLPNLLATGLISIDFVNNLILSIYHSDYDYDVFDVFVESGLLTAYDELFDKLVRNEGYLEEQSSVNKVIVSKASEEAVQIALNDSLTFAATYAALRSYDRPALIEITVDRLSLLLTDFGSRYLPRKAVEMFVKMIDDNIITDEMIVVAATLIDDGKECEQEIRSWASKGSKSLIKLILQHIYHGSFCDEDYA